ncbi:MAG: AAA family ATPase [Opitutales bacterium]|nr:AAA family ATPase [Opitutales bacterium]
MRVHILGPSGSGTTTLGEGLSKHFSIPHLDTDQFYWKKSEIPFTEKHTPKDRLTEIHKTIEEHDSWVLSGSLVSWGDPLIPLFTHVIFLYVPWEIRKERLLKREYLRYGAEALKKGGKMHEVHTEFLAWCERYDTAGTEQRSRYKHEEWLSELPSSIKQIYIEENIGQKELLERVSQFLRTHR